MMEHINKHFKVSWNDKTGITLFLITIIGISGIWIGLWLVSDPSICSNKIPEYNDQCLSFAWLAHFLLITVPVFFVAIWLAQPLTSRLE